MDDGKGEWGMKRKYDWHICLILYTNEGLKVSVTIATIATIAKRVFLAEKLRSVGIQDVKRFL